MIKMAIQKNAQIADVKKKISDFLITAFPDKLINIENDPEDDTVCRIIVYEGDGCNKIKIRNKIRRFIRKLPTIDDFDFSIGFRG